MHYILFYETSEDYPERRKEFRSEHLKLAWEAHERGELVLGGALNDPPDSAMLLFKGSSPEAAEKFAEADPYVKNGLVRKWYVKQWTTVAGKDAALPLYP